MFSFLKSRLREREREKRDIEINFGKRIWDGTFLLDLGEIKNYEARL